MRALPIMVGLAVGGMVGGGLGFALPETRGMPEAIGILAVVGVIAGGLIGFGYSALRPGPKGERLPDTIQNLSTDNNGRGGVAVGILMIVIALAWFFAGLAADRIYFYPPVLLLLGIGSIFGGVINKS